MPRLPLFTLFEDQPRTSWRPPQFRPGRIRYGQEMRRPCGCWLAPVVFGHHHAPAAIP
jgi:hypothetical protein